MGGAAHPVFVGTILEVTELPRTSDHVFLASRKVRIQVDDSFGGVSPDVHEIEVLTGAGGGDCGVPLKVGEVYLIDAFVGQDRLLHVGICSFTQKLDSAALDLRILGQRRSGQNMPSLTGQIALYDRNFNGPLGMHDPKPLADRLVRIKADGKIYDTRSDAEGFYAFYDLPSGPYSFDPDLPPGTTLSWFIGSDRPLGSFDVTAGCRERNIEVFPNGSIQGRILDSSNKLLPDVLVYIMPADSTGRENKQTLYWEGQGKEGFFKFVHLPPGRYLIVVNPENSQNPDFPYQRTFYPGVHDRASATTITLQDGEQIKNVDIKLKQQFTPRHLTVRVMWSDGRLIKNFVSVEATGTDHPAAMSRASQPDSGVSVVDLSVMPDEGYEVEAQLTCRYSDEHSSGPGAHLKSNKVHVSPRDDQTELILTMPATTCTAIPGKTLETDQ